ncbi:integrase core domain-containing protein [Luteibacter sp. 9133]|uniref:integrase core domain-containing protein n=1 Tax=Luteibacter sp. 9133 TaxID=1500891 RepID=UPI0023A9D01F|nr:integrase core domain-containing protein [Luteibacter sp. 9133]
MYWHRFESLTHAMRAIGGWIDFYNHQRPHLALRMKTPAQAYALAARPVQEVVGHYTCAGASSTVPHGGLGGFDTGSKRTKRPMTHGFGLPPEACAAGNVARPKRGAE